MGIVVIGYGGHSYVVLETCTLLGISILGYCDYQEKKKNPYELVYLGEESTELLRDKHWIVGIGDNAVRRNVYDGIASCDTAVSIIHPKAIVSTTASVGSGSFLGAGSIVNAMASMGKGSIINSGAIVEHECKLGDFVHIAPGAVLAGGVSVGNGSFVGANAVVRQNTSIGSNVTIGAGAVVVKDVPDNTVVIGNPAKALKK